MTGQVKGLAGYRSGNSGLICLHVCLTLVYTLLANFPVSFPKVFLYTVPHGSSVNNAAKVTSEYSSISLLCCSSFYAQVHHVQCTTSSVDLQSLLGAEYSSEENTADINYSSQHRQRIKTGEHELNSHSSITVNNHWL